MTYIATALSMKNDINFGKALLLVWLLVRAYMNGGKKSRGNWVLCPKFELCLIKN